MNQDMNIVAKFEGDIALAKWIETKLNSGRLGQPEFDRLQAMQKRYEAGTSTNQDDEYIQKTYFGQ